MLDKRHLLLSMLLGIAGVLVAPPALIAWADGKCAVTISGCFAKAKKSESRPVTDSPRNAPRRSAQGSASESSDRLEFRETDSGYRAYMTSAPNKQLTPAQVCQEYGLVDNCAVGIGGLIDSGGTRSTPSGTVTPYEAALRASAYLPLQPGQPTIGPSPTLNKWKMAAVGYPLWIWAEGDLDPAPVTESVSGLSVSLDANLAKIVYDLGDGTKITCGPGTPWRRGSVLAGTPSPDCGHVYTQPSLPKGDYTITATTHWSVAWTAGGQSGAIPFTQTSTTTLPVGEVQTLVR